MFLQFLAVSDFGLEYEFYKLTTIIYTWTTAASTLGFYWVSSQSLMALEEALAKAPTNRVKAHEGTLPSELEDSR
jgi:hypothetical protein